MKWECPLCATTFTKRKSLVRHTVGRCSKQKSINEVILESKTNIIPTINKKITVKLKNKQNLSPIKLNETSIIQIPETVDEKIAPESELTKLTDVVMKMMEELKKLEKKIDEKPTTVIQNQNNTLVQNLNIVCFNAKDLDLYGKKKEIHGSEKALEWLNSIMVNATPSNKFDWMKDDEIINRDKEKYPLELKPGKKLAIDIRVKPDLVISDDGSQFNKIGNEIMANSVLRAANDYMIPVIRDLDEYQDQGRFYPLYDSGIYNKKGTNVYYNYESFKNTKPNKVHIMEIAGIAKISDEIEK